jgi:hypothetical protein
MSAVGWTSLVRLFQRLGTQARGFRSHTPRRRKTTPGIESLELISLLSSVGPPIGITAVRLHDARNHRLATPVTGGQGSQDGDLAVASTPQTLPPQTVSLGDTLTNFTDQPLSPSLGLFDPSLGTLLSVAVIQSSALQSTITSQNLSPTSATVITATVSGRYQINGLNQPIVVPTETLTSQPQAAGTFGSGTDTVTFPNLQISHPSSTIFSDPASLAFFTASSGRATITPTMTANGSGSASAPNGNLLTIARTSASATVTVSYTYLPVLVPPLPCPTVGPIGRIGLHHQKTLLIVPFNGPVNPVLAGMPSNYVVTRAGRKIPIISAHYNPSSNSVTLQPAHQLNVHHRFHLKVTLPCPDGMTDHVVRVPFGTKFSLVGFHNHVGEFVPVHIHNGRLVKG